jgi:hypothetical protein
MTARAIGRRKLPSSAITALISLVVLSFGLGFGIQLVVSLSRLLTLDLPLPLNLQDAIPKPEAGHHKTRSGPKGRLAGYAIRACSQARLRS